MARTHVLGFPRIGPRRELKLALESYWKGDSGDAALLETASALRRRNWGIQRESGLDSVVTGDFSLYDQVLDHCVLLGALPSRFGIDAHALTLEQYFELARGNRDHTAMDMTKWFDTNYHYIVPELDRETSFQPGAGRFFDELTEALALGCAVKPVLIGPLTWLSLCSSRVSDFDRLTLLPALTAAYAEILRRLASAGVEWVQLDEPALCTDLDSRWSAAYEPVYKLLADAGVKILLATYFGGTGEDVPTLARLPVHGFHIDLVRAPEQLEAWRAALPQDRVLSAGIIDGRNVWRTDLTRVLGRVKPLHDALGERLWLAPSCSLLHVPVSLGSEQRIDAEVRPWLAFAHEKLHELRVLASALNAGEACVADALAASDAVVAQRRSSSRVTNELVRRRVASLTDSMTRRGSTYPVRVARQREALQVPLLPTTTIGSFPQTSAIREARARYRRREIPALDYLQRIRREIEETIRRQEALGLDVLVHGEAERNDMVEYFAESLWGYALTENGWVQSYGSRCVKPPILFGDICRPEPITVETTLYAQSLTSKPVKGMLTGPVTLLQWSFVRDDQPRALTALQLALAVRDEVEDLEKAGTRVIQIDEPALREGLPLKHGAWEAYLSWAVRCFKIAAAVVRDETQIHTHMCYSEFNDILPEIAALDADVITLETSRSNMALLDAFASFRYPNDIGPGVYDIHSPRVPDRNEMLRLLKRAVDVIPAERLWVNPDCGLKTRDWPETERALSHMVSAAHALRAEIAGDMSEQR